MNTQVRLNSFLASVFAFALLSGTTCLASESAKHNSIDLSLPSPAQLPDTVLLDSKPAVSKPIFKAGGAQDLLNVTQPMNAGLDDAAREGSLRELMYHQQALDRVAPPVVVNPNYIKY